MNTARLRSKRVLVPTIAVVAVLAVGGTVWGASAGDDEVRGGDRDRAAAAATEAAGGGTVTEVEQSDDRGVAYEVDVRLEDGTEVSVDLDEDLAVVRQETDTDQDDGDDRDDRDGDDRDADDRVLSDAERTSAEQAATKAVEGGTVLSVEAGDDPGVAYEVEVRAGDGTEWDVELDADFGVVRSAADR